MYFCSPTTVVLLKTTECVWTPAGDTTGCIVSCCDFLSPQLMCLRYSIWLLYCRSAIVLMTPETHAVTLSQVLTPCSNHHTPLWGMHPAVYGCAHGVSGFCSVSHSDTVCLLLSLGPCCFMQRGWVSSGYQLAVIVYRCKQQLSRGTSELMGSIHTSVGNSPFHSRWKCKLKREFILSNHPPLPPEGLWLVRLLGGPEKGTCYSSCTSLNKLQEGGQKRESICGKREEGETG